MVDLFSVALQNGNAVEQSYQAIIKDLPPLEATVVASFAQWVFEQSTISINIRLDIIEELVRDGKLINVHELAAELAYLSGRDATTLEQEQLGAFYLRRTSFEDAFASGRLFQYGAMNAGGLGPTAYAPYCLVLLPEFERSLEQAAYAPGDSLKIAFTEDGVLDLTSFLGLVAPYCHRHQMAASTRYMELTACSEHDWPRLLCNDGSYLEVIFIGEVNLKNVRCIRVAEEEYYRVWDVAFMNLSKKRGDAERALIHDFIVLQKAAKAQLVNVEVVL